MGRNLFVFASPRERAKQSPSSMPNRFGDCGACTAQSERDGAGSHRASRKNGLILFLALVILLAACTPAQKTALGGVMRVRDVLPVAEQWRTGGAPEGTSNHTRVLDLVWAEAGLQESWLSDFVPSSTPQTDLAATDFAVIPMIVISQ